MASDKLEMRAYKLEHDAACLERLPAGERSDFTASVARAFRATSRDIRDAAAEIARLTRELEEAREVWREVDDLLARLERFEYDAAGESEEYWRVVTIRDRIAAARRGEGGGE